MKNTTQEKIGTNNCNSNQLDDKSGHIFVHLANLPYNTILDEQGLAKCLKVDCRTIRRMVDRYELPAGVKQGNRKLWVVGKLVEFFNDRMQENIEATNKNYRKLRQHIGQ